MICPFAEGSSGFEPLMSHVCPRGGCHALPVASCFAQPSGWAFAAGGTNGARLLRKHIKLHETHAGQLARCAEVAARVRRLEGGRWQCLRCGVDYSLGKVLKHKCSGQAFLQGMARQSRAGAKKKKRRRAAAFASAASAPLPGTALKRRRLVADGDPVRSQPLDALAATFKANQRSMDAAFRRAISVGCRSGRLRLRQRGAQPLQAGFPSLIHTAVAT